MKSCGSKTLCLNKVLKKKMEQSSTGKRTKVCKETVYWRLGSIGLKKETN